MRVALRGSYVEYVFFMGVNESYPPWFAETLYDCTFTDESNYTFWVPTDERLPDYYEKQLIEDYTVFLRKPDGSIFVTDYDIFTDLYHVFKYNSFTNSGIAAYAEDCIEYVEARAGILPAGYPLWFYEYFTEAFNYPQNGETLFIFDNNTKKLSASKGSLVVDVSGCVTVTERSIFLRNKFGEIRGMTYDEFLKYYDPNPQIGG